MIKPGLCLAATVVMLYTEIGGAGPEPAMPLGEARFDLVLERVTGPAIRRHMAVLADDRMQGREAGTEGYQRAAEYVASQFARYGLVAMGEAEGHLQSIPFVSSRLVHDTARMTLHGPVGDLPLVFDEDFIMSGGFGKPCVTVRAPLVFLGYGIQAPEYGHDDYAGVDVEGRVLVVLTGAPPHFQINQRAYYSSATEKRKAAADHGALGLLMVRTPADQQRLPWSRYQSAIGSAGLRWLDAEGQPHEGFPTLQGNADLSERGAERLFELAEVNLDPLFEKHGTGQTGSFPLDLSVTLSSESEQAPIQSPNVLGMIRGSDPNLSEQVVLVTAHLDHLGTRPTEHGQDIHNGAYDNAAGVAIVLELASAIAAMNPPPRRSILFVAFTAEEMGLRGSDYMAHHPPVPIEHIVAVLNIDMPFLGFPVADVEGLGVEHSTLHPALQRATRHLGLKLTPDPRPDLVRLIRSDQFSFVKQGIPGLNIKAGSMSSNPDIDGAALRTDYLQRHYHRPSDDLSLPFSAEGTQRFARAALMMALIVSHDDSPPRWNRGDFFGERFGSRRKSVR